MFEPINGMSFMHHARIGRIDITIDPIDLHYSILTNAPVRACPGMLPVAGYWEAVRATISLPRLRSQRGGLRGCGAAGDQDTAEHQDYQ